MYSSFSTTFKFTHEVGKLQFGTEYLIPRKSFLQIDVTGMSMKLVAGQSWTLHIAEIDHLSDRYDCTLSLNPQPKSKPRNCADQFNSDESFTGPSNKVDTSEAYIAQSAFDELMGNFNALQQEYLSLQREAADLSVGRREAQAQADEINGRLGKALMDLSHSLDEQDRRALLIQSLQSKNTDLVTRLSFVEAELEESHRDVRGRDETIDDLLTRLMAAERTVAALVQAIPLMLKDGKS